MKKLLVLILLLLMCVTLAFGQFVTAKAQQEWRNFCSEINQAVRQFGMIAPSRTGD